MIASRSVRTVPALALGLLAAAWPARASSVDDSAGQVVVPFAALTKTFDTRVLVTNHETRDVKLQVRWVGERGGPAPGLTICTSFLATASQLTAFAVAAQCPQLPADPGAGMIVLLETDGDVARFSARAVVDVRSPMSGAVLQSVPVGGLPLAALDTTGNLHVVHGLRNQSPPPVRPVTTDCYVGSFFDGSGAGGLLARVTLKDASGSALGTTVFALRPFELAAVPDVFGALGGLGAPLDGARVEAVFTGKNDATLLFCVSSQEFLEKFDRTYTVSLGEVAEPADEVRRRAFTSSSSPGVGAFVMPAPPANAVRRHGVYVRHPDVVRCTVGGVAGDLAIVAVSPDGQRISSGSFPGSVEFATVGHATVANGVDELWGLEVDWAAGTAVPAFDVPYSIGCRSGNGTSLADLLLPQAP